MYLSENLQKKWEGVLDHPDLPAIKDPYRKAVTAVVALRTADSQGTFADSLGKAGPAAVAPDISGWIATPAA